MENKVADFYAEHPFPNDNPQSMEDLQKHKWILNSLPFPIDKNSQVIDVGCGTGEMSLFLSQYAKAVMGLDFNEISLKVAVENRDRLKIKNVVFYKEDITNLSYDAYIKADYIFCIGVLHHIPEVEKALVNIRKMMDDRTIFTASVYSKYGKEIGNKIADKRESEGYNKSRVMDEAYHPYEKCYERAEFRKLLEDKGFKIVGEWRKMPDWVRRITGKGGMLTYSVMLK